jgi:Na+/H+-dicarboxylate symporter
MIESIMQLSPYGVFAIVSSLVASQGLGIVQDLAVLVITVACALTLQYLLFGLMLIVFGRLSPLPFYKKILEAQSFAFSTSSSKATLPTAMRVVSERMGVSKNNTAFILPLGASINMDGTAIYLGICSLFFAQAYGIQLNSQQYLLLILTATLGSIGAAGIPGGSILMMGMVFTSVGLPLDGIAVILGIDRILDMLRTTVNITGDSVITLLVDKSEGTFNEKMYYDKSL